MSRPAIGPKLCDATYRVRTTALAIESTVPPARPTIGPKLCDETNRVSATTLIGEGSVPSARPTIGPKLGDADPGHYTMMKVSPLTGAVVRAVTVRTPPDELPVMSVACPLRFAVVVSSSKITMRPLN